MEKYLYLILFLKVFVFFSVEAQSGQPALVTVPVADLVGEPLAQRYPSQSVNIAYKHLPWSCYQSQRATSPRLHQLLLHEQVTLLDTQGDEVYIEIPHAYYYSARSLHPQHRYWTHKKNITPLTSLSRHTLKKIPPPIDFKKKEIPKNTRIISLKQPWHDKKLNVTLSAGTRCISIPHLFLKKRIDIYVLNPRTLQMGHISVPRSHIHTSCNKTNTEKISDFISLLRLWIQQSENIPYVLGGCSYTETYKPHTFTKKMNAHLLSYYDRPAQRAIKTGFDCSNLILRAAQLAGIPYFCKNTYTLARSLTPLASGERLKEGDLIWMSGHVIIMADTQKHTLIEAHSYDGGYGCVHEQPLCKLLKGIATTTDLEEAYFQKKILERLDSKGRVHKTYPSFTLLKLDSVWSTH